MQSFVFGEIAFGEGPELAQNFQVLGAKNQGVLVQKSGCSWCKHQGFLVAESRGCFVFVLRFLRSLKNPR